MRAKLQTMLRGAQRRALDKGLPFDLALEDLEALTVPVCPALGIRLDYFADSANKTSAASLDKIVPSLGYVKGNVRIISLRANAIKRDATPEELASIATYAAEATMAVLSQSAFGSS